MKQLPMMPVYETSTGDHFPSLRAAAMELGIVTANPGHELIRRPGDTPGNAAKMARHAAAAELVKLGTYSRPTLISEVRTIINDDEEISAFYAKEHGKKEISAKELAERSIKTIEQHIRAMWRPEARHLIMHSSGYDTRLVTGVLRKLHKELGDEWLGDVRFACFQPEIETAKVVFDHVGWPQEMWAPIDPDANGEDYYADCLDFRTCGKNLAEAERFWGGPLLIQLRLADYLDYPDCQGLTALFSDETLKWNRLGWGDVAWFMACYFFDNPGIMPGRPDIDFIKPFVGDEWLELLTTYHVPIKMDDFKRLMIAQIDPALAELPNFRFQIGAIRKENGGHINQQKIGAEFAARMERDYADSWYAKSIGPGYLGFDKDRVFRYYDDKNSHYLKAAIYEDLLRCGVKIELP